MKRRNLLALGVGAMALASGCSIAGGSWETSYADVIDPEVSKGWRVEEIDVQVPRTLTVSEENSYAPEADIVWREDPFGDRYDQVDEIITEAAEIGSAGLTGNRPVKLVIVMSTFHALSQKTRYGVQGAGVHNIQFTAQVFDAKTGEPLSPADPINADLIAYTGREAIASEARGETQRSRIIQHVSRVIAGWLGAGPDDVRGEFTRSGR